MGRDLVQMGKNEWWIVETVSEYGSRCSKPFESKEEAIETLRKGGCNEWILNELEECGQLLEYRNLTSGGGYSGKSCPQRGSFHQEPQ